MSGVVMKLCYDWISTLISIRRSHYMAHNVYWQMLPTAISATQSHTHTQLRYKETPFDTDAEQSPVPLQLTLLPVWSGQPSRAALEMVTHGAMYLCSPYGLLAGLESRLRSWAEGSHSASTVDMPFGPSLRKMVTFLSLDTWQTAALLLYLCK